jgi:hydroxylaminobenzene mutase
MGDYAQRLVRQGITLFLAGLFTGLAVGAMPYPRAGLAGHLEGVMNGTFLIAVGAAWKQLRLGERASRLIYGLLLFGTWANWATTTTTAILGTSKATPIAGAGHTGTPLAENVVFALLILVALAMIAACGTIVVRMWRGPAREGGTDSAA